MQFTISLKTCFFLVVLSRWKRNTFQISMKFDFKNGKTYFELLISPSFVELHCWTIVHMNHMKHIFQDLPFYCTNKVPKNHNQLFHFCHGGGTHFLVLAQTLIHQNGWLQLQGIHQMFDSNYRVSSKIGWQQK